MIGNGLRRSLFFMAKQESFHDGQLFFSDFHENTLKKL